METYNDWLAHHGIPGMKWGERNGPPYPLSPTQFSKAELKKKKIDAKTYNKQIRDIQNSREYRKGDKAYSTIERNKRNNLARGIRDGMELERLTDKMDERDQKGKSTRGLEKKRAKLIEKAKRDSQKITDRNRKLEEENKYAIEAYKKGNEKVKKILERAEDEGGFDLKTIRKYAQTGESTAINLMSNLASLGIFGAATAAGIPMIAFLGDMAPNETKVELTDRYKLKAKKN